MKTLFALASIFFAHAALAETFVPVDDLMLSDGSELEAAALSTDPIVRDHRTPYSDLVVKAINIQQTITDDVSNTPIQMVTITVQNIGTKAAQASHDEIQMNGPHYSAQVFGPNGNIPNSYLASAPIPPGKLGLMSFYLPPGTLKHCQRVSGVIDTKHLMQQGPYGIYLNDGLNVVPVVDRSNPRICTINRVGRGELQP